MMNNFLIHRFFMSTDRQNIFMCEIVKSLSLTKCFTYDIHRHREMHIHSNTQKNCPYIMKQPRANLRKSITNSHLLYPTYLRLNKIGSFLDRTI